MKNILLATGERASAGVMKLSFPAGTQVELVARPDRLLASLQARRYDIIFVDIDWLQTDSSRRQADYAEILQSFWASNPHLEIIVLSPPERIRDAVSAVKAGAGNYLTYPVDPVETAYVLESLYESLKIQTELDYFRKADTEIDKTLVTRTNTPRMRHVFDKVRMVAPTKSTVLLTGETGTGKGVVARLIHRTSNRASGPFVSVHCGAIPETLIESELFGHEKGSFTGAVRRKLGRFEIAAEGTIFLDEVGTIGPPAQIKLLQVLQDKIFQRVGGETDISMKARIVAATNNDLKNFCDRGEFRMDLYYRLNVFPIEIPPLRERREDIVLLTENFLERLRRDEPKDVRGVHPLVLEAFAAYEWPGNVRELENLMERAYIIETSHMLMPESFPRELFRDQPGLTSMPLDLTLPLAEIRNRAKDEAEQRYLRELLRANHGRLNKTAAQAGITTRQLHKLMARHGLRKEDFKRPEA